MTFPANQVHQFGGEHGEKLAEYTEHFSNTVKNFNTAKKEILAVLTLKNVAFNCVKLVFYLQNTPLQCFLERMLSWEEEQLQEPCSTQPAEQMQKQQSLE